MRNSQPKPGGVQSIGRIDTLRRADPYGGFESPPRNHPPQAPTGEAPPTDNVAHQALPTRSRVRWRRTGVASLNSVSEEFADDRQFRESRHSARCTTSLQSRSCRKRSDAAAYWDRNLTNRSRILKSNPLPEVIDEQDVGLAALVSAVVDGPLVARNRQ
jgi:hypothetical protein